MHRCRVLTLHPPPKGASSCLGDRNDAEPGGTRDFTLRLERGFDGSPRLALDRTGQAPETIITLGVVRAPRDLCEEESQFGGEQMALDRDHG